MNFGEGPHFLRSPRDRLIPVDPASEQVIEISFFQGLLQDFFDGTGLRSGEWLDKALGLPAIKYTFECFFTFFTPSSTLNRSFS